MNILGWLRRLGHERSLPGARTIDLNDLRGPKTADLEERRIPVLGQLPVQVSAVAKERPTPPGRGSDVPQLGRRRGPGTVLGSRRRNAQKSCDLAPRSRGPSPFVGRETELRLLLEARRLAAAGRGQVVLLSGEAGIGKSRLVRELCERRDDQDRLHATLRHRCSPEHALSPFDPIADLLGRDARVGRPGSGATPQRRRSSILEALLAGLEQLAQQGMVVAAYEDLQWADPSTLEFLDRMVERIERLPVLALMTFRPGFTVPWGASRGNGHLPLASLADEPCSMIIDHLARGADLSAPARAQVIACSRGVPLLVEELTGAMLQAPEEVVRDEICEDAPEIAVPSTLAEALIARLEPFPEAGQLAQIGAVIGSEFSRALLAAIAGWPEPRLDVALDQLVASALMVRSGAAPKASYAFAHALIRDAAYHSLPDDVRRNLHARIAQILDADRAGGAASTPERAARHYAAAGLIEPAVAAWLRAGERAADQGAYSEAIAGFSKGLELLDSMRATTEPVALRAQLLAALARTLTVTKGVAAPEVAQASALARTLLTSADVTPRLFSAVRSLWDYYNTRGELEAASELAGRCPQLVVGADDPRVRVEADFCLGVSSLFAGQLAEARERLMRGVVPGAAPERGELAPGERQDSRSFALAHLAQVLWLGGHPDEAVRVGEEAVATARAIGHPFGLTYALLTVSWVAQFRRDAHATHALAAEALMCAKTEGFPGFLAMAKILRDWAAAERGTAKPTAAVSRMRAALDAYRSAGVEIARPYLLALLAEVHGSAAKVEHALALLAEGAEVACATGERWYEAEIRRQEGELLLRQSITNRRLASARFCQAIALAQQQGGKALELRATLSLARLWADSGRRTQAHDLLAPVYGWFKEGLATADLEAAKALLDDLS